MRLLDGVVQLSVLSRAQTAPPANPIAGDRYILPSGATGAWAGFDNSLAHWEENAWRIIPPKEGWVAWDQNGLALFPGSVDRRHRCGCRAHGQAWTQHIRRFDKPIGGFLRRNIADPQHNRRASTENQQGSARGYRQPVVSNRLVGRAEMGLTGSDNFEIKVSPDGSNFHQALTIDRATGAVTLPNTTLSQAEFGTSPIVTVDHTNSKTGNLVSNGNGDLGNSYNMPSALSYDASDTPGLPGSFLFTGYHGLNLTTSEFIAVDAQKTYRLESYIKQATGDRSIGAIISWREFLYNAAAVVQKL